MPLDEVRAIRSRSFGSVAERYHRYRPAPPAAAVDWVLGERRHTVVDLGAGTGALSRLLANRAERVIAVEPDARMRETLARVSPGICIVAGRAEALPLVDGVVDAVTASASWHWVDPEPGFAEAARVLVPGGVLGLLWNAPDRTVPWVAQLFGPPSSISTRPSNGAGEGGGVGEPDTVRDIERRHLRDVQLPPGAPFESPTTMAIPWSRSFTADELVGLAGTYSRVITLPEPERAAVLDRVSATLASHPDLAGRDQIELPMICWCWRAVRRSHY